MFVSQPIIILTGFVMLFVFAILAFTVRYGGVDHAWREFNQDESLVVRNATEIGLCAALTETPVPLDALPSDTSGCVGDDLGAHTGIRLQANPPCSSNMYLTIYDPASVSAIYARTEACGGFQDTTVIVNRDSEGQWIVTDTLPIQ